MFVSASYSFPSRLTIVRFYDRVIRRRGGFGCGDIVSAGLGWILGLLSSSKYGYYSGPDTNGERESVIVSEVSSFQRFKCMQEWYLGWEKVSCLERCPHFRG